MIKSKHFIKCIFFFIISHSIYSQETEERNYTTFDEFLTEQSQKISKIENGLTEAEVNTVMGNAIVVNIPKVKKMDPLNQLFKQPEFIDTYTIDLENKLKILWYFSSPKDQNGIISKGECSPILIKNDSVIGKGVIFYKRFKWANQRLFLKKFKKTTNN